MANPQEQFGHIGVLMGGVSSEREISLKSGKAIYESLRRQNFNVTPVDIRDKELSSIRAAVEKEDLDVAFIALHGRMGEDGTIQALLEEMQIPYTGSGVEASRLALDKIAAQDLLKKRGIPVAAYVTLSKEETFNHDGVIQEIDFFPVVVKPAREGSSIGISLVENEDGLPEALQQAWKYDDRVLVEKYIQGRELTVGILDGKALTVVEIHPKQGFFDFTAKYTAGMSEYTVPAILEDRVTVALKETALKAHQALGCADFSRVDFILAPGGDFYVLEVNTIPGFTATSLLPKAAAAGGITFDQLCVKLITLAYGKTKKIKNIS